MQRNMTSNQRTTMPSFYWLLSCSGNWSVFSHLLVILVGTALLLPTVTQACFIRNCPLGGKRDGGHLSQHFSRAADMHHARQCTQCGPGGMGQCVGPAICCGPNMGCYMNTAETEVCRTENDSPIPCHVRAIRTCVAAQNGKCVDNGICCKDERCLLDAMCDQELEESGIRSGAEEVFESGERQSKRHLVNPLQFYIDRLLDNYKL